MCIDYRKLKSKTADDPYQMPRTDELVETIGRAKYISTLDLSKGYYQVPVAEEDKPKTAFTSPFGKFEFNRMSFGLKGAPSTFQRLMDEVLVGTDDYATAYLDDVVIYSATWDQHLRDLEDIFKKSTAAGLTMKRSKCQFAKAECTLLGHVVGRGDIKPEECKLKAIRDFKQPLTKKDVRSFLGLAGYYRHFIPSFSEVSAVLSDLTKKGSPEKIKWEGSHQQAFLRLKERLLQGPTLTCPDYNKTFILQTDASDRGVGAVLSQQEGSDDRPIAFYSRKLMPRETKYTTTEKECLAVVNAVKHFSVYLLGRTFKIITDHGALKYLDSMRNGGA